MDWRYQQLLNMATDRRPAMNPLLPRGEGAPEVRAPRGRRPLRLEVLRADRIVVDEDTTAEVAGIAEVRRSARRWDRSRVRG
jgi:hypothetical protein